MSKNKEIHVPNPINVREEANEKIIIKWIDKIEKAKRDGKTSCYVVDLFDCGVTKNAVQKFLDAGYDIYYQHLMSSGEWLSKFIGKMGVVEEFIMNINVHILTSDQCSHIKKKT